MLRGFSALEDVPLVASMRPCSMQAAFGNTGARALRPVCGAGTLAVWQGRELGTACWHAG